MDDKPEEFTRREDGHVEKPRTTRGIWRSVAATNKKLRNRELTRRDAN
jgi:hypothetical protein